MNCQTYTVTIQITARTVTSDGTPVAHLRNPSLNSARALQLILQYITMTIQKVST